jgi:hypothetical protein
MDEKFDHVITLGERAPSLDGNFPCTEIVHWKFDDPGALDDPEKQLRHFRMVRSDSSAAALIRSCDLDSRARLLFLSTFGDVLRSGANEDDTLCGKDDKLPSIPKGE